MRKVTPSEISKNIYVKMVRDYQGLSVEEFALKTGTTPSFIKKIEDFSINLSDFDLKVLASESGEGIELYQSLLSAMNCDFIYNLISDKEFVATTVSNDKYFETGPFGEKIAKEKRL